MERIPSTASPQRVALVYDRLNSWGGAERVLLALQKLYPEAPLFTSVYEKNSARWAKGFRVKTSFLQRWAWLRNRHRWFGWLMPLAFETLDFSQFNMIISVTSEAAKGVITGPEQLHICYLLTPTRYLWSHEKEYRETLPKFWQPLVKKVQKIFQKWDRMAAQRSDYMIPISGLVQTRAQQFYKRKIEAPVYPGFSPLPNPQAPRRLSPENFVFSWGRHVPYKYFDRVILAAHKAGLPVVMAGSGPDTRRLKAGAQASDHEAGVQFVGKISDAELAWYLQQATCAVFPQVEDFGIAPLEALSQGCPVVIHRESGVAELLQEGKDGIWIQDSEVRSIVAALQSVQQQTWSRLDIQSRARQYAEESFQQNWKKTVHALWQEHQQQLKGSV